MFDNISGLVILSSGSGVSKRNTAVQNRKNHSFLFRLSGSVRYDFADRSITVNPGEMMFLPRGVSYEGHVVSECDSTYTNITFSADMENTKPTAYSTETFPETDYICSHFPDLWKFGNQAEKYKCISLFYSLLSYLSAIENMTYADRKKFFIIEPAVNYLKSHIYDSSLKADTLNRLCGISNTYFRKIFSANFGTTPQKYIVNKRISHAKSIIDSGDFDTITEVAESVGYSDPLYFSRAFRKKYGISPMNMSKL